MKLLLICLMILIGRSSRAETPLLVGDSAPDFTLAYATKDTIVNNGFSLSSHLGKNLIVLAFYPANWSGGCTKEMCTMRDNFADLSTLGAEIYGISGDYVYSHREWAKSLDLQFALLSDHLHKVAQAYSSYNSETGFNKRTVYVIDQKGKIAYIDLNYSVRTPDSFNALKAALAKLN